MDLTALVAALNTAVQQATDEKQAEQADIDAKNTIISDAKAAIKDDQGVQGMDDAIVAGAQAFLEELLPFLPPVPPTP